MICSFRRSKQAYGFCQASYTMGLVLHGVIIGTSSGFRGKEGVEVHKDERLVCRLYGYDDQLRTYLFGIFPQRVI